jgi:hypothetical protein
MSDKEGARSRASRKVWSDPERRRRQSEHMKRKCRDPEFVADRAARHRAAMDELRADPERYARWRRRLSDARRRNHAEMAAAMQALERLARANGWPRSRNGGWVVPVGRIKPD